MCGIVGVFGQINVNDEKAFKDMLVLDQLRGPHSTGVAAISRKNATPTVVKTVGGAYELFDMKQFDQVLVPLNRVLLGHNRFATSGKINRANAHPFTFGDVTGVHNGSLRSYSNLSGYKDFEVDSQVLYNHIAEHGLRDAVDNSSGAMALVWWNAKTESVQLYRNSERPLCYATVEGSRAVYIASELWMIQIAASRNGVKLMDSGDVPVDTMFTYELNDVTSELTTPHAVLVQKKMETYTSFKQGGSYGGYGSYGSYHNNQALGSVVGESKATSSNVVAITNQSVSSFPAGVECMLYDIRRIHSCDWAIFSEVDGDREFCMTVHESERLMLIEGSFIRADTNGFIMSHAQNGNTPDKFFRINVKTVRITHAVPVDKASDLIVDEQTNEAYTTFTNNRGEEVTRANWYKQYGVCAYCTGDVSHKDNFRFNTTGGIYCEECITSPQIEEALPA